MREPGACGASGGFSRAAQRSCHRSSMATRLQACCRSAQALAGSAFPRTKKPCRRAPLVSLMRGNWTYFPSLAWRREALDPIGFRQDLDVALDLVALASLVLDGATMLLLPDVVFEYRRHLGSVSSQGATSAGRFIEERRVMGELAARARECGWHRASRAARFRFTSRAHAVALLPDAIRSRSWDPARKYVRHAFGP